MATPTEGAPLRKVTSWADDEDSSDGEDEDEGFDGRNTKAAPPTFSATPTEVS